MALPTRKHLSRLRELYRLPVGEIYLLTVNCAKRRRIFAETNRARIAVETFADYAARHGYGVLLYTVMPDHVHAIVAAHEGSSSLSELVSRWKTWCARKLRDIGVEGRVWQGEFFDHRIRSEASLGEKCEYVANNPVRAALIERAENWSHTGGAWWDQHLARQREG
ncbi:MAG: transposase [Verrucomicrobia bacterium]|nr:transposase [Verrucomicrobiota bacterium]